MARLVEDSSNDEFPDVNEVIRISKLKTELKTTTRKPPNKQSSESSNSRISTSNSKTTIITEVKELDGNEFSGPENSKPKARKRLLKQTTDNPLLKPLNSSTSLASGDTRKATVSRAPTKRSKTSEPIPKPKASKPISKPKSVPRPRRAQTPDSEKDEDDSDDAAIRRQIASETEGNRKSPTHKSKKVVSENEEDAQDESDDLSDFIVDDDEEDSDVFTPPPKLTRKLVRGRRPKLEDSDSEEDTLAELLDRTSLKDKSPPSKPKLPQKNELRPGSSSSFDDHDAVLRL